MKSNWPFDDSPDSLAYALLGIMDRKIPIRLVYHDSDDESWQFFDDGGPWPDSNYLAVDLAEVVNLDPSIHELADLPVGWWAWRPTELSPWERYDRRDDF